LTTAGAPKSLVTELVSNLVELNASIAKPESGLGSGFAIGHSFFCPAKGVVADAAWYQRIIEGEIQPLLEEYWFDEPDRVSTAMETLSCRSGTAIPVQNIYYLLSYAWDRLRNGIASAM
jgi:5-methylcytosine-specific restriction protein B